MPTERGILDMASKY